MRSRWDDDVVFKNQARGTEDKKPKEFVNDLLRSDFHKRFMVTENQHDHDKQLTRSRTDTCDEFGCLALMSTRLALFSSEAFDWFIGCKITSPAPNGSGIL